MDAAEGGLRQVREAYEQLGREDPLWAVLSGKQYHGNRWDPDEFFLNGERCVADLFSYVDRLGVEVKRGRALDFGCGAGRLSQALADRFDEVWGVDISSTMLDAAERLNRKGDRIRFLLNTTGNLADVPSGSVDFLFTTLTLQHIPTQFQENYIREFLRVLRPGGVAVFDALNPSRFSPESFRGRLVRARLRMRRAWRRITGRAAVEIHYIRRADVESLIAAGGCELRDVVDRQPDKPGHELRYCAVKP